MNSQNYVSLAAGAAGGAGLSASVFEAVGLSKVLMSPASYPIEYPVIIFGLAAFFAIVITMVTRETKPTGRRFGKAGACFFAFIILAGFVSVGADRYVKHEISISEEVLPDMSGFEDPDKDRPVKFSIVYYSDDGNRTSFKSGPRKVKSNDKVQIRL